MRALVTGGAGFIGSSLVDRLLAEGHEVDVVDDLSTGSLANLSDARSGRTGRLHIHQVDVRDDAVVDLVTRLSPDVVFHLAGRPPSSDAVVEDAEVTVVGGLRVLDAARRAGARKVVVASTSEIYRAPEASELPIRESHPRQPAHAHGVAAKALTDYLAAYRETHALEFTALALGEVYGPRQRGGLVFDLATSLTSGAPGSIDVEATRDLVFVDDVVDAFVRAAERGGGLLVNVASGTETTLGDLAERIAVRLGVDVAIPAGRRRRRQPGDRIALDRGRARIHLGWEPWTALDDGLDLVVDRLSGP